VKNLIMCLIVIGCTGCAQIKDGSLFHTGGAFLDKTCKTLDFAHVLWEDSEDHAAHIEAENGTN